ncbi:DNA (cytosine-5-)-methyltransferase [Bartonella sp. HY329]|uniref:DNA cytosine methyltransferase n=1 Tax=unclassified Bartonella TaxID=2645622 RepID=UPI0021CA5E91|nr:MULTISPECIES: DNA (cytosine-5-)-methyltransferase [unclassified Bartonella]UXM94301.1 DNA (cytosine-5-)-methyltransferase [Bartonella sp. HY329]UXN08624.1 DNA (cytosine-5-)-methyltransferase [Bartonella sp. HY328]
MIANTVVKQKTKLKILDLFSGIGGFSLGLERTGGFETVAFCEIEKHAQKVLKRHWPHIPIYDDVTTLNYNRLQNDGIRQIDVITGGFPCQDISIAGKQAGLETERSGLWSHIPRLANEIRPQYIIVENVADLLRGPTRQPGRWFGRVLGDLAEIGYNAEWHCIPASAVGAPHKRDRVWIIAYQQGQTNPANFREKRVQGSKQETLSGFAAFQRFQNVRRIEDLRERPDLPPPLFRGSCDGLPYWMDRIAECGNAVVPQIPELIGAVIINHHQSNLSGMQNDQSNKA